ncbi:MAG: prepilin-type N-terminal cleavage/methylation domain-containing protein [Thermodesulfovibrionales bacterium]
MRIRPQGYTLLEVLVAMAIFSSMVMLATMALNQGLKQYHGLMEKGINFWDRAKGLWMDGSFGSLLDYYVRKENGDWFPYFYGSQERVSYVSLSPLAGDMPVAVWIVKERRGAGKYAVVYYELPVYTKSLKDLERDFLLGDYRKGNSLVLLDDVEKVELDFYGYDTPEQKSGWFRDFDAGKKLSLPSLVKLTYTGEQGKQTLHFGINTNSRRKGGYNEVY